MERIYIEKLQLDMPTQKDFTFELKAGLNILRGRDGVGKTYLLNSLVKYLDALKSDSQAQSDIKVTFPHNDTILAKKCVNYVYIPDYSDAPLNTAKINMETRYEGLQIYTMMGHEVPSRSDVIPPNYHNTSPLLLDLQWAIFGGKSLVTFIYEMGEMYANSGFKGTLEDMRERYECFKYAVNYYLGKSGKKIQISSDSSKSLVCFTKNNGNDILELADLSSAEKKLLLLLVSALTLNNSDSIFISDMPFKGLDGISKTILMGHLYKLSPNCQFIFTAFSSKLMVGDVVVGGDRFLNDGMPINYIQLPDLDFDE